jgi:hypothetical protein
MAHKLSLHRAFYQLGYWLGKYFLNHYQAKKIGKMLHGVDRA